MIVLNRHVENKHQSGLRPGQLVARAVSAVGIDRIAWCCVKVGILSTRLIRIILNRCTLELACRDSSPTGAVVVSVWAIQRGWSLHGTQDRTSSRD